MMIMKKSMVTVKLPTHNKEFYSPCPERGTNGSRGVTAMARIIAACSQQVVNRERVVQMISKRGFLPLMVILVGFLMMGTSVALASDEAPANEPAVSNSNILDTIGAKAIGGGIGAGLVVMGGAAGIGRIGGSAVESMARQPEVAGQISTAMIITAAMIEGATLFAVLGCFLALL